MYSRPSVIVRLAVLVVASVLAAAVGACTPSLECFEAGYSGTYVDHSGAVAITVSSTELIISNNSPYPIYHEIFPNELLRLIEWGPCENPSECPELRTDPEDVKRYDLHSLVYEDERHFTVFWWHLSEPEAGLILSSKELGVEWIEVELPARVACE